MNSSPHSLDQHSKELASLQSLLTQFVPAGEDSDSDDNLKRFCDNLLEREATLRQRTRELEAEKQSWHFEQLEQTKRLEQEADQLREAWGSLENEQRLVLANQAGSAVTAADQEGDARDLAGPPQAANRDSPARQAGHDSREAAVRQFQQLGREIVQHNRRVQ